MLNIANGDLPSEWELPGEEWFEELALYAEGVIHHSTLSARTFSEVLTLEQQDGLASGKRKVKGGNKSVILTSGFQMVLACFTWWLKRLRSMLSEWPAYVHFA